MYLIKYAIQVDGRRFSELLEPNDRVPNESIELDGISDWEIRNSFRPLTVWADLRGELTLITLNRKYSYNINPESADYHPDHEYLREISAFECTLFELTGADAVLRFDEYLLEVWEEQGGEEIIHPNSFAKFVEWLRTEYAQSLHWKWLRRGQAK